DALQLFWSHARMVWQGPYNRVLYVAVTSLPPKCRMHCCWEGPMGRREVVENKVLAGGPKRAYVRYQTKDIKHSRGHENCPLCEPARAMQPSEILPSALFENAIDQYLNMRRTVPLSVPLSQARDFYGGQPLTRNRRRRRAALLAGNTQNSY